MYFMKLAEERYSVRSFDERPISEEHMNIILISLTGYTLSEAKKT